ncbi:MAG TPA: cation:proton antiporter [Cyclobacteriaceae bacterium]|nr:cation:proton antiporter [Cyclobacteriaceae bacterium]
MGKFPHEAVVHLLIQLSVMLLMARLFAEIARRLKQPAVVGEILAGIILGPTIMGMLQPEWFTTLFPPGAASGVVLSGMVQVAVVMLLFIAGLEVDLHIVWQQGKVAVVTSLFGLVIPFAIGFIFPYYYPQFFGIAENSSEFIFALFMGTAMSITALPVIVRILMDTGLFKTRTGLLVVASAMIDDTVGWLIFSLILGMIGKSSEGLPILSTTILTLAFTGIMLTVGRGVINRILPWLNKNLAWPGGILSLALAFAFLGASFTEYIGIHAVFGAFIIGVCIGDSEHFSERAKEIVHQFINNIFAPLFFVSIGLRVNFFSNFDPMLTLVIIVIAFVGKVVGCGIGTRIGGATWREALAAGFGMNARGAMEIILGLVALENGLINEKVFVSLVIMALVTSMTSGPLMKRILNMKPE